jgi:hypothetical protein
MAAPGQPPGVLLHGDPGDQPLVVAVELHAEVDDRAGLARTRAVLGLDGHPPVQQVTEHQQLVRPLLEPAQVQRPGAQHHGLGVHGGHPADRQEDPPAQRHLGHQTDHLWRAAAGAQADDRVANPADPIAVGVEHGQRGEPREVNPGAHGHSTSLG